MPVQFPLSVIQVGGPLSAGLQWAGAPECFKPTGHQLEYATKCMQMRDECRPVLRQHDVAWIATGSALATKSAVHVENSSRTSCGGAAFWLPGCSRMPKCLCRMGCGDVQLCGQHCHMGVKLAPALCCTDLVRRPALQAGAGL